MAGLFLNWILVYKQCSNVHAILDGSLLNISNFVFINFLVFCII